MSGAFWQRVLESEMAVPADRPLPDLTAELVTMLGSANPVERDEIAYPVLATWIGEGVYDDLLVSFGDSVSNGLTVSIGEREGDAVFRRSFSALVLTECLARDNQRHLLPVDVVLNWADRSISWFTREQDLRGWVADKGWVHTVAHGADLIGTLGLSRHLDAPQLTVLLDVIAERLLSADSRVLVHGEDDRLAYAVLQILQRNLVDATQLELWVETLASALELAGSAEPGPTVAARNTSHFLRALHAHLAIGISPAHPSVSFTEAPAVRADLLLALLRAIPRFTPWLYSSADSPHD